MSKNQKDLWLIPLAFFMVYVVWGTTYLANSWGVEVVPPFLFSGFRFLVAGSLLLFFSSLFTPIKVTRNQLKRLAFSGLMLFGVANGLLTWALQYVDSGITALVVAFEPLMVAFLLWQMKRQRPNLSTWVGISLGIVGMILLIGQPKFVSSWEWIIGVILILVAIFSWGYMSIWITSADLPRNVFHSAGIQMVFGGVILLGASFFIGDFHSMVWEKVNNRILFSWGYLILFGSISAFTAFNYLLLKVSPTKVAASAYVHPVIALGLGWWLNNEILSNQSLLAAAILMTGVIFINREKMH